MATGISDCEVGR